MIPEPRAVAAEPDNTFLLSKECERIYSGRNRIEKKHPQRPLAPPRLIPSIDHMATPPTSSGGGMDAAGFLQAAHIDAGDEPQPPPATPTAAWFRLPYSS
jgi:hypothetical protein